MQNYIHGAKKFRMCKLYENIFQSIGLDHYYYGILIQTYLNIFFGKAVQDKELSWRLEMSSRFYQNITRLIFHHGNKHIYAV